TTTRDRGTDRVRSSVRRIAEALDPWRQSRKDRLKLAAESTPLTNAVSVQATGDLSGAGAGHRAASAAVGDLEHFVAPGGANEFADRPSAFWRIGDEILI